MPNSPVGDLLDPLATILSARPIPAVLAVAMDLGVFPKLKDKRLTLAEAAEAWGLQTSSARALAQGLCSLKLLHYREGQLAVAPLVERVLLPDPFIWGFVDKSCHTPPEPVDTLKKQLRDPEPQGWYQIRDEGAEPEDANLMEDFYRGAHSVRLWWGRVLAETYDFAGHQVLMDVGGASGGWCMGVRERFPHLQCIIFDMPPACLAADELIAEGGHQGHVKTVVGSFFTDDLPEEADAILLANVLHDWDLDDCRHILRRVHRALPAGGVVLVSEFFFEDDWTSQDWMAVGQAIAVNGEEGKCGWQPAYGEMEELLREEGFARACRKRNLVVGEKAAS